MKHVILNIGLLLLAVLFVACGGGHDGLDPATDVGELAQPLREAGTLPVPCSDGKHVWPGTSTTLLFGDAMEVCGLGSGDQAISATAEERWEVTGQATTWREYRANRYRNCDPDDATQYRSAELPESAVPEEFGEAPPDVLWALKNLCIANYMRNASSGAGLLLAEADQRELLTTIKQRVQIAMLHLASLGVAFETGRWSSDESIKAMYDWGRDNPELLEAMGRDFATAVTLHSVISEEIANLIARSRSSNTPTGADAPTYADKTWGAGSWQHRMMAAMVGGDPLAAGQKAPWRNPWENENPGAIEGYKGTWPTREWQPYVREYVEDPAVQRFVGLLRRFDAMRFPTRTFSTPFTGTYMYSWDTCTVIDDQAPAASDMYELLEKALQCEALGDPSLDCGCHFEESSDSCLGSDVTLPASRDDYILKTAYGVAGDHAGQAMRLLSQTVGPVFKIKNRFGGFSVPKNWTGCVGERGAYDVLGEVSFDGTAVVINKDARFVPRSVRQYSAAYHGFSPFGYPAWNYVNGASPEGFADLLGFRWDHRNDWQGDLKIEGWHSGKSCSEVADRQRTMGSLQAMAALRGLLHVADAHDSQNPIFASYSDVVDIVQAQAGTTVQVTPLFASGPEGNKYPTTCEDWQKNTGWTPRNQWAVNIFPTQDDDYWSEDVMLYVLDSDAWLASRLRSNGPVVLGRNASNVIAEAISSDDLAKVNTYYVARLLGVPSSANRPLTLVAYRADRGYRILGESLEVGPAQIAESFYFTLDNGSLSRWVEEQMTPDPLNPAEPAYDGFGKPRNWVPPTNSKLFGESAELPAFRYYLSAASQAADEATRAVERAFQNLIEEQKDAVDTEHQLTRAEQSFSEETQVLCGADKDDCDLEQVSAKPDDTWFALSALREKGKSCVVGSDDPKKNSACIAKTAVELIEDTEFQLAKPVLDRMGSSETPQFSEYSGGELQSALLEQWRALKLGVGGEIELLAQQLTAFDKSVDAGVSRVDAIRIKVNNECDSELTDEDVWNAVTSAASAIARAFAEKAAAALFDGATIATAAAAGATAGSVVPGIGTLIGTAVAVIGATLYEIFSGPSDECLEAQADMEAAIDATGASIGEAIFGLYQRGNTYQQSLVAVAQASAAIERILLKANLAKERYELESELATQDKVTSFGLTRRYRAYDLWRARALLDSARGYGLAAMRAVESHYVVNLSRLSGNEAFVASPMSWAGEIYEYDLSLPRAVGLSVSSGDTTGYYSNKVSDWVQNLQSFVDGYGVSRPTAVADSDVGIVTVPGFGGGADGWLLYCDGTGDWRPISNGGTPSGACFEREACLEWWAAEVESETPSGTALREDFGDLLASSDAALDLFDTYFLAVELGLARLSVEMPSRLPPISGGRALGGSLPVGGIDWELGPEFPAEPEPEVPAEPSVPAPSVVPKCNDDFDETACREAIRATMANPAYNAKWATILSGGERSVHLLSANGARVVADELNLRGACAYSKPSMARRSFGLDPWGQLVTDMTARSPLDTRRRHNARWTQLAVNMVGTSVITCEDAADPLACYARGWIPYNLRHDSDPEITNYDGESRTLRFSPGAIELAKATANERWLDPLRDGWGASYVSAIARSEFYWRPLGGNYVLTLEAGDEVQLDNLERVQIMIGSSYWVRQD